MTRRSSSRTIGRPANDLLTLRNSATSLPERSPESTVSFTLPMRSRRASRSSRNCSSRFTRPSLRVRRASTPLRIQTSSCAQNLSNLRLSTRLLGQLLGLAPLVCGVVAGVRAQQAAVEFDDARGHPVEEGPVVRDDDGRRVAGHQQALELLDAVDVEVIGRLVQQQYVGFQGKRAGERGALAFAAGEPGCRGGAFESEAMQVLYDPRVDPPAHPLVFEGIQIGPERD